MDGNTPVTPDRNSITISVRFKCNMCDFQCLRLPEAEQHSMKQHCTIQPFLCNTCTVSCKTYHDALSHLATPSASHWRPPKMEERDIERWAQFQFVLTSYTVFLTVTCRDDILFICDLCNHSTTDTEAAVKHLVSHNIWKRDNVKGHCDICTFFYLSGIECIKQLRDFSGALNGCTHNIAACLLSNLKISLQPFTGRIGLKSQTINWSALFSKKKPNLSGNAVSMIPDMPVRQEPFVQQRNFGYNGGKFTNTAWPNVSSFAQPNHINPMIQPHPPAPSWFSPGDQFSANPVFPSPTVLYNQAQTLMGPPRPEFLPPPSNPLGATRLTFEQHMARERMLWLIDERNKRQMMRARPKRLSETQISPTTPGINKEPLTLIEKENKTSGRKRSRPNNSQPVVVIDLTDPEGDEGQNAPAATGVDNVSSTTSNGDADNSTKNVENSTEKDTGESAESKPKETCVAGDQSKEEKDVSESELHSTVSSNQSEMTHVPYEEIFLDDDNGFIGDVTCEEDDVDQQILDLSVKKGAPAAIKPTEISPLDLTSELSDGSM